MVNVYSDKHQSALRYLKDTEVNIHNVFVMARNFNIRDRNWNSSYPHHSAYSDILIGVADSLKLKLFSSVYQVLTQYADDTNDSKLVINPIFLQSDFVKIDNNFILPDS